MKKILFFFSALSMVLISSCSSDDNESNAILPKTLKYTDAEYPSENSTYISTYNGNKIVSVKDEAGRTDYTYDGDVIVKEINYDTESEIGKDVKSDEVVYTYANGKLIGEVSSEGFSTKFPTGEYKIRRAYTYNADGSIKVERYNTNATGVETKSNYIEVLTFLNGNLIKSVETNSDSNSVFTAVYEYDTKNNPLKNILGFNLLVDHNEGEGSIASVNNVVKYSASYSGDTQVNVYKSELTYNTNDYPTKIISYKADGTTVDRTNEYNY